MVCSNRSLVAAVLAVLTLAAPAVAQQNISQPSPVTVTNTPNVSVVNTPTVSVTSMPATTVVSQSTASNLLVTATPPSLNKGIQGGVGFTTQDLKDAGRQRVLFTADAVAPATTETLVTFTKNVNGTATASQTTYSVTSGKTLRVQAIHVYYAVTSTTLSEIRVALRENTGGACTASSALAVRLGAGMPVTTATSVAHEAATQADFAIPDGLEFPASDSLCLSAVATSASSAMTITLVGYEY